MESHTASFCFSPSVLGIMVNQEEEMAFAVSMALQQGVLGAKDTLLRAADRAGLISQQPLQGAEPVGLIAQAHQGPLESEGTCMLLTWA